VTDPTLLARLENYYDTVPRATADGEAVGPFTLFVAREGWPYYARPTLGSDAEFTVDDVREVLDRQQQLGVPQHLEWVDEITPTLLPATQEAGVPVAKCALMVLSGEPVEPRLDGVSLRLLRPDDDAFGSARAAVDAGFGERDTLTAEPVVEAIAAQVQLGRMRVAGAFDPEGRAIGGGSHAPRGDVTEVTGIGVIPAWRRRGIGAALAGLLARDARELGVATVFLSAASESVARVYERVGFVRVGTACIAEYDK
jgi:GNAT superfamily N-acetyltransferase